MKGKEYGWNGIRVMLNGKEITGIKSVEFTPKFTLEQLQDMLQEAEQNEEYLVCAKLKKQIDNYKE
jgi:hypothetical protein